MVRASIERVAMPRRVNEMVTYLIDTPYDNLELGSVVDIYPKGEGPAAADPAARAEVKAARAAGIEEGIAEAVVAGSDALRVACAASHSEGVEWAAKWMDRDGLDKRAVVLRNSYVPDAAPDAVAGAVDSKTLAWATAAVDLVAKEHDMHKPLQYGAMHVRHLRGLLVEATALDAARREALTQKLQWESRAAKAMAREAELEDNIISLAAQLATANAQARGDRKERCGQIKDLCRVLEETTGFPADEWAQWSATWSHGHRGSRPGADAPTDAARVDGRNEGLMAAMECVEECGMPGWQSVNVHIASLLVITPTDANAAALPDAPTAPADPVTRIQDGAFGIVRFHDNGLQILTIGHAGEVENMVAVLREKTSAATDAPYAPTKAERCAAARARIGYAFAGVMDCARAGSKHDEHPYRWEVTIIADGKHGFYYGPDEPSALEAAADALEVAQ